VITFFLSVTSKAPLIKLFWADTNIFHFSLPITDTDILHYSNHCWKMLLHCNEEPYNINFYTNLGHQNSKPQQHIPWFVHRQSFAYCAKTCERMLLHRTVYLDQLCPTKMAYWAKNYATVLARAPHWMTYFWGQHTEWLTLILAN